MTRNKGGAGILKDLEVLNINSFLFKFLILLVCKFSVWIVQLHMYFCEMYVQVFIGTAQLWLLRRTLVLHVCVYVCAQMFVFVQVNACWCPSLNQHVSMCVCLYTCPPQCLSSVPK